MAVIEGGGGDGGRRNMVTLKSNSEHSDVGISDAMPNGRRLASVLIWRTVMAARIAFVIRANLVTICSRISYYIISLQRDFLPSAE